MNRTIRSCSALGACFSSFAIWLSGPHGTAPVQAAEAELGQGVLQPAIRATLVKFADRGLASNQIAATLIDLRAANRPVWASYRGDVPIYPASVVKLFYLVAAHRWLEDGKLEATDELHRALRDMIVESYNEATHYVVDLLTGTTSGPELALDELDAWYERRNAVNRYFASMGYRNVNANRKPWCEGPYGREVQSVRRHQPNRNLLTTDATARLLLEIVQGRAVSVARSGAMMDLLRRDPFSPTKDPEDQAHGFTGIALAPGAKLWSKAGWTSQTRHDAAYVELPGGGRFVLVVFTEGHSNEREIIPSVARETMQRLGIVATGL